LAEAVKLLGLGTAVPEHVMYQADIETMAAKIFSERMVQFLRLLPVYKNTGIAKRHFVRPMEWFFTPRGWPDRMNTYLEEGVALFTAAATKALAASGLQAQDIDTVVTVSSTGIATPSLEARAALAMGFRADIQRVPLFGLGCAGGVSGLAIARNMALARPGSRVLLVAVEICSMSFRLEGGIADVVASSLFADGAAACVLSAAPGGFAELTSSGEYLWPDTLNIMGWRTDEIGLGVIFDRDIPPFAQANIRPAIDTILAASGRSRADIDRFIAHPGGAKVVAALETGLELKPGSLDHERAVLADYGNMSAPTVLFVLERVLADGLPERGALIGLGPGFTASCVTLQRL
jgi:alkylresorcinol/alkylpyrone synthase